MKYEKIEDTKPNSSQKENRFDLAEELREEHTVPTEEDFRMAMQKRQYDEAMDIIHDILLADKRKAEGRVENIDPNHIEMARRLVEKSFEHEVSLMEPKSGFRTTRFKVREYLEKDVMPPTSKHLKALMLLSELLNFKVQVTPELSDPDSLMRKTLKLSYDHALEEKQYQKAYEFGRVAGTLNKEEYRKFYKMAVDRMFVHDAFRYALEGELFDLDNNTVKELLEEYNTLSSEIKKLEESRKKSWHDFRDGDLSYQKHKDDMERVRGQIKSLQKRKDEIVELLVVSVE